jgi:hypothetical protein
VQGVRKLHKTRGKGKHLTSKIIDMKNTGKKSEEPWRQIACTFVTQDYTAGSLPNTEISFITKSIYTPCNFTYVPLTSGVDTKDTDFPAVWENRQFNTGIKKFV